MSINATMTGFANYLEVSIMEEVLRAMSQKQRERLRYIEFTLYFLGEVRRSDLSQQFEVGLAVITRDFAEYKKLAPQNIRFDDSAKRYVIGEAFHPIFDYQIDNVLSALSKGFNEGLSGAVPMLGNCEYPTSLSNPKLEVLAPISRAIHRGKAVQISYCSQSSGSSNRELVPFALIDNGLRWHVRAYDRKSKEFRDFVLTRILSPQILEDNFVVAAEKPDRDNQWTRIVELELVPHPDNQDPIIAGMDYAMRDEAKLKVKLRAAVAGYMLLRWNVDCTATHKLRGAVYQLWLKNHLALYDVESAHLAPGYREPN